MEKLDEMLNQIFRAPLKAIETHVPNMVAVGVVRKKPFNYKVGRTASYIHVDRSI